MLRAGRLMADYVLVIDIGDLAAGPGIHGSERPDVWVWLYFARPRNIEACPVFSNFSPSSRQDKANGGTSDQCRVANQCHH